MRISDWSSDVCSSDLPVSVEGGRMGKTSRHRRRAAGLARRCSAVALAAMLLAAPASSAEVTVQDRAILVDGRPFVVRGAAGTTQLAELKGLGANTVRTYGGNADRLVAEAERLGRKVILERKSVV